MAISPVIQAADWFVATTGNNNNPGTLASPFQTLPKAIEVAHYGDTIFMRAGDYREPVAFGPPGSGGWPQSPGLNMGGASSNSMLTIRNYNNEVVTIKGSDIVTGWQQFSSNPQMTIWQVPWAAPSSPDWCPECTQQIFVDGQLLGHVGWNCPLSLYPWNGNPTASAAALAQVKNAAGVSVLDQNTAHMTNWSFYHNVNGNTIYIALPTGTDPNTKLVEVSTKMPFLMVYDYVRVQGLKFRHSNLLPVTGTWAGVGMSSYSILDQCEFQWCDFAGVSVAHHCLITNCFVANNGMMGANPWGTNTTVTSSRFLTNFYLGFDLRGESGGAKIIGGDGFADSCLWKDNEFGWNRSEGLWFDTKEVRNLGNESLMRPIIVRNNFSHDNRGDGYFIEHTSGIRIYNNVAVRNGARELYLSAATYAWVFNNTFVAPLGAYIPLDVDWRGVPQTEVPHHIWITNNIVASVETGQEIGGVEPQIVVLHAYGNCSGANNMFYDYNGWLISGTRPDQDYFDLANLDIYNSMSDPDCSPQPPQCVFWWKLGLCCNQLCSGGVAPDAWAFRLSFVDWQAFGHDPHGLPVISATAVNDAFVNVAADDYRIRLNSPFAQSGVNLFTQVQDDFLHKPRPATGGFSIGAFQASGDTVTLSATTKVIREAGSATLTLSRSGNLTDQALTVQVSVGGDATPGSDFQVLVNGIPATISGGQFSATFPANQTTVLLTLQTLDDSTLEHREAETFTVLSGATYLVGTQNSHTVSILDNEAKMVGGLQHSLAIRPDQNGALWSWGQNTFGQLGIGPSTNRWTFVTVSGLSQIVDASADGHNVAAKADGTVWTWGINEFGQLGDGLTANRNLPFQVPSIGSVVAVASGRFHTLVLKSDGTIWGWGLNSSGQLGDGTTTQRFNPVQVQGISNAVAISAGYTHSLALLADGGVRAWGANNSGQLGDGTTTGRLTPVFVTITGVRSIASRNNKSHAIRWDGTAWSWGQNTHGGLGDGTTTDRSLPVQMVGIGAAKSIASGYYHAVVLKDDGTVWAVGYNSYGQVGDGTFTSPRLTAVPCSGLTLNPASPNSVAAGQYHSLGSMSNMQTMWSWGNGASGQLGNNSTANSSVPANVWD